MEGRQLAHDMLKCCPLPNEAMVWAFRLLQWAFVLWAFVCVDFCSILKSLNGGTMASLR